MLGSILKIISSIFWIVIRGFKAKDDPQNKQQKNIQENATIIANSEQDALNAKLDRQLNELPNTTKSGNNS